MRLSRSRAVSIVGGGRAEPRKTPRRASQSSENSEKPRTAPHSPAAPSEPKSACALLPPCLPAGLASRGTSGSAAPTARPDPGMARGCDPRLLPTQSRAILHRIGELSWLHRAQAGGGTPGQAQGTSSPGKRPHTLLGSWHSKARRGLDPGSTEGPLHGVAQESTAQLTGRQGMARSPA